MGLAVCVHCGEARTRIRETKKYRRPQYIDAAGKLWCGTYCHDCKKKKRTIYRRANGELPRDMIMERCNKKGRDSERTAERHFIGLGYSVIINQVTGPDLTIIKDGVAQTVEVKSVLCDDRNKGLSVAPVYKTRLGDDLICYVYNEKCVVTTMTDHLANCTRSGSRTVTRLFYDKKDMVIARLSRRKKSKSGIKGVRKMRGKWQAYIHMNGKQKCLGVFNDINDARQAYDRQREIMIKQITADLT